MPSIHLATCLHSEALLSLQLFTLSKIENEAVHLYRKVVFMHAETQSTCLEVACDINELHTKNWAHAHKSVPAIRHPELCAHFS